MAHVVWKRWLEAYAEGRLCWPLSCLVEVHTRRCTGCRRELWQQVKLLEEVDSLLFRQEEIARTVVCAMGSQAQRAGWTPAAFSRSFPLMLAGAGAIVLLLALVPPRLSSWLTPATVSVAASSSWGESTAVTVAVSQAGLGGKGSSLPNSSGVGKGTASAWALGSPDVSSEEERGGLT